jgi:4-hydroxy-2-oxoheptanedioate aldolase
MQYGTWCILPSPEVVSVLAHNLDVVILDREHGTASYADIYNMCAAAQRECVMVLARPSSNNEAEILHLLDCGVNGIMIPHVQSVIDVQEFLEYTNFPPIGSRGYTPFVYGAQYGAHKDDPQWKDHTNLQIYRAVIIEDDAGRRELPSILKTPIDMVYIGVYDLSTSLGMSVDDPRMNDIFTQMAKQIKAARKALGAIFHDEASLQFLRSNNVDLAVYKTDTAILFDGTKTLRSM